MATPIDDICMRQIAVAELGYTDKEITDDDAKIEDEKLGLTESVEKYKRMFSKEEIIEAIEK